MEIKGWAVAVVFDPVDEDAKDCEPSEGDEDVDGPDVEDAGGGHEPDQSQQHGEAGDNDGVGVSS